MMQVYINPASSEWAKLYARPTQELEQLADKVQAILAKIKEKGDEAVKAYTKQFDQVDLENLQVSEAEIELAIQSLDPALKEAIQTAKANIERFHQQQQLQPAIVETMPGVKCWRKNVAIDKVGLYIPGGTAPLFSTVLMLGVPAQIAGCKEIVLCSPPQKNGSMHPAMVYAAHLVGVTKLFKVGGVQAVGAMAFGTETIPNVYKIFGPGNQYVTAAKQLVYQNGISIDMPAGPSEVLVCADHTASPAFVAADLLSQAEHGIDSQVVLVAFEENFVKEVEAELKKQVATLPRQSIAEQALANSATFVLPSREQAIELINAYAPEHLILAVNQVDDFANQITNAGSVFMGNYTPESVGDYASGTNHTLPTNGFARMYSGVSLDSFVKKITFQQLSPTGLQTLGPTVEIMAEAEELMAHKQAVSIRLKSLKNGN